MAYNPEADRPPSPVETRELYDATRGYLMGYNNGAAFSLSSPSEPAAPNLDRVHSEGSRFYGFPFLAVGNTIDMGAHPLTTYPPTWQLRFKDLGRVHELVPEAGEILGVNEELLLLHHGLYVKYEGGSDRPSTDKAPEPPDCAIVIPAPDMPGRPDLRIRTYKLVPEAYEPKHARGTRTDMLHGSREPVRTPEGAMPLLGVTEWQVLVGVVDALRIMQPESTRRRRRQV